MEAEELYRCLEDFSALNGDTLSGLREIITAYPYFQTARMLYLKNLFLMHDESFQAELRRGSLYVADLSVLFYYIEGDKFVIQKHTPEHSSAETADRTLDLIERFLSESPESSPGQVEMPLSMEVNLDYTSVLLEDTPEDTVETKTPPLRGQELIDSFIACDCSGKALPEERKVEQSGSTEQNSAVKKNLTVEAKDVSLEMEQQESDRADEMKKESSVSVETEEDESYFTETLAKIYIKQQRYDKALEIIKKLNLKYPKKNIYFADQIRFLEKLIINAKSK